MKLICVLVSFVFVIVLADQIRDDKKELYYTNYQLGLMHKSDLDALIKILLKSNLPIDAMVILLVTPDFHGPDLEARGKNERTLQILIQTTYVYILEPPTRNTDFDNMTLSNLGEARRNIIYPSLKRILADVESGTSQLDPLKVCHLVALLKSAKDPSQRITNSVSADDGCCTIVTLNNITSYYKQYLDGIHKLDSLDGTKVLELRVELLR